MPYPHVAIWSPQRFNLYSSIAVHTLKQGFCNSVHMVHVPFFKAISSMDTGHLTVTKIAWLSLSDKQLKDIKTPAEKNAISKIAFWDWLI